MKNAHMQCVFFELLANDRLLRVFEEVIDNVLRNAFYKNST